MAKATKVVPSRVPGLMLGIGLGGFVDGIVLHQLLQWHHLLSASDEYPMTTVAGLEVNTLADGAFHVLAWVFVLLGTNMTVGAWQRRELAPRWRLHVGLLLTGWGLFNLVEGLISHQILSLHHVRDDLGGPLSWDFGFLFFGALLMAVGTWLGKHSPAPNGPSA